MCWLVSSPGDLTYAQNQAIRMFQMTFSLRRKNARYLRLTLCYKSLPIAGLDLIQKITWSQLPLTGVEFTIRQT